MLKYSVHCVLCHWDFKLCINPSLTLFWRRKHNLFLKKYKILFYWCKNYKRMVSIVCVLHEPITVQGRLVSFAKQRRHLRQSFGHLHCTCYVQYLWPNQSKTCLFSRKFWFFFCEKMFEIFQVYKFVSPCEYCTNNLEGRL